VICVKFVVIRVELFFLKLCFHWQRVEKCRHLVFLGHACSICATVYCMGRAYTTCKLHRSCMLYMHDCIDCTLYYMHVQRLHM
jgi:hypothetical protein